MKLLSCLEIAGIKPEEIAKWKAEGFGRAKVERAGSDAAADGQVISRWIDVSPAMATAWLKNNFRNRPVADDVVSAYARDMVSGVWLPTHQGIAFNVRDELIDGQHRLLAVIKSGKTVRMMVTFGLEAQIEGSSMTLMDCVDRGRTRSVADQLKIQHGLKNGTQIAQIASALAGLCRERIKRLSVAQTLDIYRAFGPAMDFVIEHRSKSAGLKSAGVLAGFAFAMVNEDGSNVPLPKLPGQAFKALNSGEGLEAFPNVKLLREFLMGQDASLILASMNRGIAELTVQVLYLEGSKQRVEKLEFSLDGVMHFRAAQPGRVAMVSAMFALPSVVLADGHQKKVEPVAESHSAAPRTPAQPAPAAAKERPTLDKIFSKVEAHFKLSRFIITGRGSDADINTARIVFVHLARAVGHTPGVVAAALKRTEERMVGFTVPMEAMNGKQKASVAAVKAKL